MLTLYIIRHGSTRFNEQQKLQGQLDFPLTAQGTMDAKLMAILLKKVRLDAIYSSDLKRAKMTAEIVRKSLGFPKNIISTPLLREIDAGKVSGYPKAEIHRRYPSYKKQASFTFPGGESYADVQRRVLRFFRLLEKQCPDDVVLIVTHSGCIRSLICGLRGKPLEKYLNMPISHRFLMKMAISNGRLKAYKRLHN